VSPVTTAGGWPAPVQPADGEAGLLGEAFRLFADSRKHLLSRKAEEVLPATAIDPLRRHLHDDLYTLFATLRGADDQTPPLLAHYPWPSEWMGLAAQARALVQLLADPASRRPKSVAALADPAQRRKISYRRLEDLDAASAELRGLARRAALEAALKASFGPDIVTPWGGTRVIARADRAPTTHPKGGYVQHELFGMGPSQKLRQEFLTTAFRKARAELKDVPEIAATAAGGPPFRAHLEIERRIDILVGEVLPPTRKAMPSLTKWLDDLRRIEVRYAAASNLPEGAAVGLPLGAVLAAVLRAYLYDLIAHVLVLAVPAERVRVEMDGYLGVALYEAFSGKLAKHLDRDGYLTTDPADPLLERFASWRVTPFAEAWPSAVVEHANAASALMALAPKPVMLKPGETTDWEAWQETWRRYPVTKAPGIWRRAADPHADWYTGAHLSAQCHLYVANWILRVAIDDLALPGHKTADTLERHFFDRDDPAGVLLATPRNESPQGDPTRALQTIAGSSLWNSRKPPHKTHNDAASFDLRFGPNTPGWSYADFGKTLATYLPRGAEYKNPFTIHTHRSGRDSKNRATIEWVERGVVFEPMIKKIVKDELAKLTARLGKAVSGPSWRSTTRSRAGWPAPRTGCTSSASRRSTPATWRSCSPGPRR
jgi:hypothetical protein